MNKRMIGLAVLLIGASACNQQQPQSDANLSTLMPKPGSPPPKAPPPPAPHPQPAAIDPKSDKAAVQLVQGFADLLNQRKFDQAYMLLGPAAPSRAEFEHRFSAYQDLKVEAGAAGDQQGAAGSIYLSVPLTISGAIGGKRQSDSATAIVRRVNDVDGSTEAQRRWHIERIDWSDAA